MQPTVGGTITRSMHRLLGTLGAGGLGYIAVSIAFVVQNEEWRQILLVAETGALPDLEGDEILRYRHSSHDSSVYILLVALLSTVHLAGANRLPPCSLPLTPFSACRCP